VQWASAPAPVAAVVGPDAAALIHGDPEETARALAKERGPDGDAWRQLWQWWEAIGTSFLELMLGPIGAPRPALRFAWAARRQGILRVARTLLQPLESLAGERFEAACAQVLVAAGASHFDVGVDQPGSVPAPLVLAMTAQHHGMPVPVGGAGRLSAAMVRACSDAGGSVRTGADVRRVVVERGRAVAVEAADGTVLRVRRAVLADTGPAALFGALVDDGAIPAGYLHGIRRFRYGIGVFKVDLALDGAVPWTVPELGSCAVVHLTGDLGTMALASHQARHHQLPERPMLVVGQQSVADPTRAPAGGHTLWIETHVPGTPAAGTWATRRDGFTDVVLDLVEAHAPGLRSRVVGCAVRTPPELEAENPNLVGGDLGAGSNALDQQLVFRPVPGWFRYATPVRGLYLCSASAHPGGGVHGMAGRNAARRVLADHRRRRI
jgi:phytoene dehydrogenase-like protein